jgi:hypothetical protein
MHRRIGIEALCRRQRASDEGDVFAQPVAANPAAMLPDGPLETNRVHHSKVYGTV